jgi:hypothetical protein
MVMQIIRIFYPRPQCHIKARALRAAAQGPRFKRGPQSYVSVYILNKKALADSMKTLY